MTGDSSIMPMAGGTRSLLQPQAHTRQCAPPRAAGSEVAVTHRWPRLSQMVAVGLRAGNLRHPFLVQGRGPLIPQRTITQAPALPRPESPAKVPPLSNSPWQ